MRKKNILIFGANSHLAKIFSEKYSDTYNLHHVYRNKEGALNFDFTNDNDYNTFAEKINYAIDAIIFFQGINNGVLGFLRLSKFIFLKKIN